MLKAIPNWERADCELKRVCINEAERLYGKDLPKQVSDRLNEELKNIIEHGFEGVYLITKEMIENSGLMANACYFRGDIGNSFVAYLCGVTNTVNPLPPHYRCKKGHFSEFDFDGAIGSFTELPQKMCPICGAPLIRDGFDLDTVFWMSVDGDEEPDIDINVPIHHVDRIADCLRNHRSVASIIMEGKKEGNTIVPRFSDCYMRGYYIIPKKSAEMVPSNELYSFNDELIADYKASEINTVFLKEQILGHRATSMLWALQQYTGICSEEIDLFDDNVLELFQSWVGIKTRPDQIELGVIGTRGIPEFSENYMTRFMCEVKRPRTFEELVKLSAMTHAEGAWVGNAYDLLIHDEVSWHDVIATRDDVYEACVKNGIDKCASYQIAISVGHGLGLSEQMENAMRGAGLSNWYIESCKKIKHLFPKGHCIAYTLQSWRVAYYKIYHPKEFYQAYFNEMVTEDIRKKLLGGREANIRQLEDMDCPIDKDENYKLREALEVAEEMYTRGFNVL